LLAAQWLILPTLFLENTEKAAITTVITHVLTQTVTTSAVPTVQGAVTILLAITIITITFTVRHCHLSHHHCCCGRPVVPTQPTSIRYERVLVIYPYLYSQLMLFYATTFLIYFVVSSGERMAVDTWANETGRSRREWSWLCCLW
jgi:hypothetical protein